MANAAGPRQAAAESALLLEQLLQVARISALEEMASGIAHELNQPIGAIATYAQAAVRMLAKPDPPVASAIEVLQHISEEALHAGQGLRRIQGLFNGHHEGRTECEPAEVLAELLPVLDLLAARHGTRVSSSVQVDLPRLAIDCLRIQHVLFSLVQNALEVPALNGGPPHVRIVVSGDRFGVRVAVEDHGVGVAGSARGQLFRPFFTTKARGTGLGLASSKAIVEAHDGSIQFEDIEGGGTRFILRLPAAPRTEAILS